MTARPVPSLLGIPEELRLVIWTLVVPERMVKCFRIKSHILSTGCTDLIYGYGKIWCDDDDCSSQSRKHQGNQGTQPWANPLLPLMLINKHMKQEINSLSIRLLPTLVFCSQPHASTFFFRFNNSALPADMAVPSAYEIRKDIYLDSICHHRGETVEKVKVCVDPALEITLKDQFGLQGIPAFERKVTYVAEYERRFPWHHPQCMGTVGSDLQRLGAGFWRFVKKYRTEHYLCDGDECFAKDRNR
jgi:hypothetical protein